MDVPRRNRVDKFTPAERAIWDAQQSVEAMPADVRLTRAGDLLQQARDLVADFVDGVKPWTEMMGLPEKPERPEHPKDNGCDRENGNPCEWCRHIVFVHDGRAR